MSMNRRILMEPNRIRVSFPGHDAKTASLDDLAFDSNFALMGMSASNEYDGQVRVRNIFGGTNPFNERPEKVFFRPAFDNDSPPFFLFKWKTPGAFNAQAPNVNHLPYTGPGDNDQTSFRGVTAVVEGGNVIFRYFGPNPTSYAMVDFKALVLK